MNKRRLEEAVLNGGPADAEAAARRVNAEPWQPLPGMVKRQCPDCRYWFATSDPRTPRCSDCVALGTRPVAAHPL
jgi:hypothetical protein